MNSPSFGAQELEVDKDNIEEKQGMDEQLTHSRWRCFTRDWIRNTKGDSLDISWLKDKNNINAANLPELDVLVEETKMELEAALSEMNKLLAVLEGLD